MSTKGKSAILRRAASTGRYVVDVPQSVRTAAGLKGGDAIIFTTAPDVAISLSVGGPLLAFDAGCARFTGAELLQ